MLTNLIALAALDSLNPFSLATLIYLLGIRQPLHHSAIFITATFACYLLGGALFVAGAKTVLIYWIQNIPNFWLAGGKIATGAACILFAIYAWRPQAKAYKFKPPPNISFTTTFGIALIATASDLPTAMPYFAAVSMIAEANTSWSTQALLLTVYCAVYVSPLLFLATLHAYFKQQAIKTFVRIQAAFDWIHIKLIPPMLAVAGLWLIYVGITR